MLRLAFDFIITWRETRTRPNAYDVVSYSRNSNGAADYRSLTREILSRLNMVDNK